MGSAPTGLTWDGTFLWNCDCGTDMFYKIDVGFTTAVEEVAGVQIPEGFDLAQNYPNPFNPSTTIRYSLPQSSFVTLKIYNLLGKEIESLVSGQKPAGEYEIHWTTKDLPSGIYLYRLKAGEYIETRKFILQK